VCDRVRHVELRGLSGDSASIMLRTDRMRVAPLAPSVHLFVCANRRPESSPLGQGCGAAGEAVFGALKAEVARRGAYRAVWITQTLCLGICPKKGCTVASYPQQRIVSEVEVGEAVALLDAAIAGTA
jgi:(2Fe-2S) ferredoxin